MTEKTVDKPENILVIRNDRLGDFMLAYPTFNVVKKLFPSAIIHALVPEYTKPMAELCPWIDKIIIDEPANGLSGVVKTTAKIKEHRIDAVLCLHSSLRIALSLFLAGIPHRFAPASRIDQVFYNHRLTQRRSRSEKPEFEYNIDLANFMGGFYSLAPASADQPPYLAFPKQAVDEQKTMILDGQQLDSNQKIVIVHAGSGGSAINLSIEQYAELIHLLSANESAFFILTAGPGEENMAQELSSLIKSCKHEVHTSTGGLKDFSKYIAASDLFISGSTGVLHIASALNIPTVAFYPSRRSATSVRWQTLNTDDNRLSFTLGNKNSTGFPEIDLEEVCREINNKYFAPGSS
jgi:ADP-heptose:LPS heptosyltransferase